MALFRSLDVSRKDGSSERTMVVLVAEPESRVVLRLDNHKRAIDRSRSWLHQNCRTCIRVYKLQFHVCFRSQQFDNVLKELLDNSNSRRPGQNLFVSIYF